MKTRKQSRVVPLQIFSPDNSKEGSSRRLLRFSVSPQNNNGDHDSTDSALASILRNGTLSKAQQPAAASKSEKKKKVKREAEEENPEDFIDPETHLGEKKKLFRQMAETYNPSAVENLWYEWWEKSDFFKADSKAPSHLLLLLSWRRKL